MTRVEEIVVKVGATKDTDIQLIKNWYEAKIGVDMVTAGLRESHKGYPSDPDTVNSVYFAIRYPLEKEFNIIKVKLHDRFPSMCW